MIRLDNSGVKIYIENDKLIISIKKDNEFRVQAIQYDRASSIVMRIIDKTEDVDQTEFFFRVVYDNSLRDAKLTSFYIDDEDIRLLGSFTKCLYELVEKWIKDNEDAIQLEKR